MIHLKRLGIGLLLILYATSFFGLFVFCITHPWVGVIFGILFISYFFGFLATLDDGNVDLD